MVIGAMLLYFVLFIFIFSSPEKLREREGFVKRVLLIPALLAILFGFITVIKVYFIYKIVIFLFIGFTALLTYWQWGGKIKRWWRS